MSILTEQQEAKIEKISDSYDRGCDSCPFKEECNAYEDAFGQGECLRDDWGKALFDFIKQSEKGNKNAEKT